MTDPQQPDAGGASTNDPNEEVTHVVPSPGVDPAAPASDAVQPPPPTVAPVAPQAQQYPAPGQPASPYATPGQPPAPGYPQQAAQQQVPVPPGMAAPAAQQAQYGQQSQPAPYGQPGQPAQYGQPVQYGQPGQPGQYPQPGQAQPGQAPYPGAPFGPPPGASKGSGTGLKVIVGVLGAIVLIGGLLAFTAFVAPGWAPKKLSQQGAQDGVTQILTKNYQVTKVSNVSCPDGERVKKGESFECRVTVEGRQQKVTVTFVDNKGGFEVGPPH